MSVGAPGFEPGTSSPPDCFNRVAGDGPTWREMASLLASRPILVPIPRSFQTSVFARLCPECDRARPPMELMPNARETLVARRKGRLPELP
jgi:hypothetical protein